ncbi:peptidoglycan-binding protein [Salibacterium salarium]|uniref:Peptidoglycan-binding protein n=1 Tax=Salibacterium salarium TaxID=284579 RepID=A0A3R9QR96_9BACI|nr:peptidoglycan-binding protein [Salibacterium salarium]RSL31666.1 peptidoglycan-binding protein [Salibacterium salarium]
MKLKPSFHTWKTLGIPALATTIVLLATPVGAKASELVSSELESGQENTQVEQLQELLNERGFLEDHQVNGTFGAETTTAIEDYQDKHGLDEDGVAGPITVGSLEILSEGDEGEPVKTLQEQLNILGFLDQKADGEFESNTHDAVLAFQQSEDILVDGLAGPQTFGALTAETEAVHEKQDNTASKKQTTAKDHSENVASESSQSTESEGRTINVSATAYTADCSGCSGVTSTGVDLNANPNAKVIAVDPDVIPLGSKVEIEGYGTYTAADTGGSIHGNKIDVHMPNKSKAYDFGRRNVDVTILE